MVEIFKKALRFYLRKRWHLKNKYISNVLLEDFLNDYKQHKLPYIKIWIIHNRGFVVSDWLFLQLNKENYKRYLSNAQYYAMHPINGEYSYIIDDKWTLKQHCSGTELDKYMPEYYYRIDKEGKIESLMDCPYESEDVSAKDVAKLLRDKGALAIKLVSGSIGKGFIKGEFRSGKLYLNGEQFDENEFCTRISELRNYLITEYLYPHNDLAKYCPYTCNCIRYLVGRMYNKMQLIKGYIRFGTKKSGFVENYNAGGVLCYLSEEGIFTEGNVIDYSNGLNRVICNHPDNGVKLEGKIPHWKEITEAAEKFGEVFTQLDYLGIDFVVTSDERVKVLEINSLTSLDGIQLNGSILDTNAGDFYRELMK